MTGKRGWAFLGVVAFASVALSAADFASESDRGPAARAPAPPSAAATLVPSPPAVTLTPTGLPSTGLAPGSRATATPGPAPEPVRVYLPPADTVYEVTGTPAVTLTFDDGPDPKWTPRVLAVLERHHVRAVFCMIGYRVRSHPELVRAVVAGGNALCNHTIDHDPALGTKTVATMEENLRENSRLITAASGGVAPRYFRAPHGDFTPALVHVARRLGMASLGWEVTSSDWQWPLMTPENMANWVGRTMKPGCLILFHDGGSPGTHAHTVAGLDLVLSDLDRRGWPTTVF